MPLVNMKALARAAAAMDKRTPAFPRANNTAFRRLNLRRQSVVTDVLRAEKVVSPPGSGIARVAAALHSSKDVILTSTQSITAN